MIKCGRMAFFACSLVWALWMFMTLQLLVQAFLKCVMWYTDRDIKLWSASLQVDRETARQIFYNSPTSFFSYQMLTLTRMLLNANIIYPDKWLSLLCNFVGYCLESLQIFYFHCLFSFSSADMTAFCQTEWLYDLNNSVCASHIRGKWSCEYGLYNLALVRISQKGWNKLHDTCVKFGKVELMQLVSFTQGLTVVVSGMHRST